MQKEAKGRMTMKKGPTKCMPKMRGSGEGKDLLKGIMTPTTQYTWGGGYSISLCLIFIPCIKNSAI